MPSPSPAAPVLLGVSLKMYLGHASTLRWVEAVRDIADRHPVVRAGQAELFVMPSFPALEGVAGLLAGSFVRFGAQDLSAHDHGAYTGEVSGPFLAEVGCTYVEVGHAERRRMFGEDEDVVRLKTEAALRAGLVPVLCVGEWHRQPAEAAAERCVASVESATSVLADARAEAGAAPARVVVAYEPHWAIGAAEPAPAEHTAVVCDRLRAHVRDRAGLTGDVIYGGSAGVGLLSRLQGRVDGLFLGRFAHDPRALEAILDEVGGTR